MLEVTPILGVQTPLKSVGDFSKMRQDYAVSTYLLKVRILLISPRLRFGGIFNYCIFKESLIQYDHQGLGVVDCEDRREGF